jgi:hypothetical protein
LLLLYGFSLSADSAHLRWLLLCCVVSIGALSPLITLNRNLISV